MALAAAAVVGLAGWAPAGAQVFVGPPRPFGPPVPPWGFGPPVIIVPPPVIVIGGMTPGNPYAELFRDYPRPAPTTPAPPRNPNNDGLPVGAKKGEFVIIRPKRDAAPAPAAAVPPGVIEPMVERVAPPAPPVFDPLAPAAPVNLERPDADPAKEAARLVKLAREAFAAGEYGKAAAQLDRAIAARADDPAPYFLQAQARFAAGQYADAAEAIRQGMRLAPDWPASGFNPKEPYGPAADRFAAHLVALRKALDANPTAPALEFLLGYQLWFSGDRPAAAALFRSAARHAPGNPLIARFLREADGKPGP